MDEQFYDEEAERAAIGAALMDSRAAKLVCTKMQPEDFYLPQHSLMFKAMRSLYNQNGAVDVTMLRHTLAKHNLMQKVGGVLYLANVAESVGSVSNADHYVHFVQQLSDKRKLHSKLSDLLAKCRNGHDPMTIRKEIADILKQPGADGGWLSKLGEPLEWPFLPDEPNIPWIVEKLIARNAITQFVGLWKAGKTTVLAALLNHIARGKMFAGLSVQKTKCLVISEEASWMWKLRGTEIGATENVYFWCRPFMGRASWEQWESFVNDVAEIAQQRALGCVVFDALPALWPVEKENDAGEMARAVMPIQRITESGAAVVLVHHPRKGEGNQGQAARGSGVFAGVADIIIELRRLEPDNMEDRRRVLSVMRRFGNDELVLEYKGGSTFHYIGTKADALSSEFFLTVSQILRDADDALTSVDIRNRWPTDDPPTERTIRRILAAAADAGDFVQVSKATSGRGGEKARYRLADVIPDFDPFAEDEI